MRIVDSISAFLIGMLVGLALMLIGVPLVIIAAMMAAFYWVALTADLI